ncbi:MAG: DUF4249 domain-containing protein [Saprospiraceae bacterium]|nr:DUF4249 domain-containing protein [Saprospiraceae bacterium]MCF8250158.1 DUF4249 domain-containing protein [Saprospiraceae bacterium]MCF8279421.1 DUF4249 domain-containing protein [Bacteroidales bacterium]MCF8311212.1 DUF4249 domain-containing protein [Saprospiraceae bacterium]MCF8440408.1 DUF4249 domain-containing protein [Saprospiraceae bacterium]
MQINKISAFCFAIIALGLASCGGDKFSQVVEIDLPEHVPMLSVSAEFSNVDTMLLANVGTTWPTTDQPADPTVKDATVRIYENGTLWRELVYNTSNNGTGRYDWTGNANFVADGSTVYRLEVTAPGFETVFAEQKMPKVVEILSLKYMIEGGVNPDGEKVDELTFEFQDPVGEGDYYALAAFRRESYTYVENGDTMTYTYTNDLNIDSYDPLLEIGANDLLLLSDKSFNGKKASFKAYCYSYFGEETQNTVIGQLYHLTREKYLYLRSLNQYQNASGNPFAEPVTVQSNIENGVGVFSLEALDTIQVRF